MVIFCKYDNKGIFFVCVIYWSIICLNFDFCDFLRSYYLHGKCVWLRVWWENMFTVNVGLNKPKKKKRRSMGVPSINDKTKYRKNYYRWTLTICVQHIIIFYRRWQLKWRTKRQWQNIIVAMFLYRYNIGDFFFLYKRQQYTVTDILSIFIWQYKYTLFMQSFTWQGNNNNMHADNDGRYISISMKRKKNIPLLSLSYTL